MVLAGHHYSGEHHLFWVASLEGVEGGVRAI